MSEDRELADLNEGVARLLGWRMEPVIAPQRAGEAPSWDGVTYKLLDPTGAIRGYQWETDALSANTFLPRFSSEWGAAGEVFEWIGARGYGWNVRYLSRQNLYRAELDRGGQVVRSAFATMPLVAVCRAVVTTFKEGA